MGVYIQKLVEMEPGQTKCFVTSLLISFKWYVFLFPFGMRQNKNENLFTKAPKNAEYGEDKVCIMDFTLPSDEALSYFYQKWHDHAPSNMNNEAIKAYRIALTNNNDHGCCEKLFFSLMFPNKDYKPSIVFFNSNENILVNRIYTPSKHDLYNSSMLLEKIVRRMRDNTNCKEIFKIISTFLGPPLDLGTLDKRKVSLSLSSVFADYIDMAPDYIESFHNNPCIEQENSNEINIKLKRTRREIKYTKRFYREWKKFENEFKNLIIKAIYKMIENGQIDGKNLKQIRLTENRKIYRLRLNDRYRLHFIGKPSKPILINAGPHKLYEYGYRIG